jgi:ABC-type branched-subunit amino acid transport system permease subunit
MCVIGGNGTIIGPIIGAFFMNALFVVTDIYLVQVHPIVAGMLIILVMKFMPRGLIGLIDTIRSRK